MSMVTVRVADGRQVVLSQSKPIPTIVVGGDSQLSAGTYRAIGDRTQWELISDSRYAVVEASRVAALVADGAIEAP